MKNYSNFCFSYERIKLEGKYLDPPVSPDLTAWAAIQQNILREKREYVTSSTNFRTFFFVVVFVF